MILCHETIIFKIWVPGKILRWPVETADTSAIGSYPDIPKMVLQ